MLRPSTIVALLFLAAAAVFAQEATDTAPLDKPAQAPRKVRVSGGVLLGLVEHRTLPQYPEEAMRAGTQGDVIFKIVVDENGKIKQAEAVDGDSLLVAASLDALRGFRFRPFLLNSVPVPWVESQIGFHFAVARKGTSVSGNVECMSKIPDRPEFRNAGTLTSATFVLWPHRVSGVEPKLPAEFEGKRGSVYLTVTIGAEGKVQDVKVVGGEEPFVDPVVAAVKEFVYEPELVDGKPTVATTEVSYHFGQPQ